MEFIYNWGEYPQSFFWGTSDVLTQLVIENVDTCLAYFMLHN